MNWINVKDNLPPCKYYVDSNESDFVWGVLNGKVIECWYNDKWGWDSNDTDAGINISHWKKLTKTKPKPPKN